MEHVVFYPASDGSPAFRRLATLEEAVSLVEHLRNVGGVSSVSVHALTEVPLAFRAYYKVEVPHLGAAVAPVVQAPAPEELAYAVPSLEALAYAVPSLEAPSYVVPSLEEPSYVVPSLEEPSYVVPSLEEPTVEEPAFEQPAFEEPAFDQPAYEAPVLEAVPALDEAEVDEPVLVPEQPLVASNGRGAPSLGFFA